MKNDIKQSKVFNNTFALDDRWDSDNGLYMFAIPMLNGDINYELIESCIQKVKVNLLGMFSTEKIMELRSADSPLYPIVNEELKTNELKEKLLKFSVFDLWTNGGKYFYCNLQPGYELKNNFSSIKDERNKKEDKKEDRKTKRSDLKFIPKTN